MASNERPPTNEWKWIRSEVIIRDEYECQDCGALGGRKGGTTLHVHHIEPVQNGGKNDRENLITLCAECHADKHAISDNTDGSKSALCRSPTEALERDESSGEFVATFTEEDFETAITAVDLATTSNIADHADCAYRTAYEYLRQLEDDGDVTRSKIGTTSVWKLTDGEEG